MDKNAEARERRGGRGRGRRRAEEDEKEGDNEVTKMLQGTVSIPMLNTSMLSDCK